MIMFYSLPTDGPLRITSKYGPRNTGIKNASSFHHGVDLGRDKPKAKTNLLLVAPGIVLLNGWHKYRGWYIVVRCTGFDVLYQHMESQSIHKVGTILKTGTILGIMGNSSDKSVLSVPLHLHFAICEDFSKPTENGRDYTDPEPYLRSIKTEDDMTKQEVIEIINEVLKGSTVAPQKWSQEALAWAVSEEIISDDKTPDRRLTKEETVTILYRFNKLMEGVKK